MTISWTPAWTSPLIVLCRRGSPPIGSKCLGFFSASGQRRSPFPAARIAAFNLSLSLQDLSQVSKCFFHNSRCFGSILRFSGHAYHRLRTAIPDENPGGLSAHPQPE